MGCRFTFNYSQSLEPIFVLGRKEADAFGGQVTGDNKRGTFNIPAMGSRFEGYYEVSEELVEIVLTKKPIFLPCSVIYTFLSKHIN
jgi:hypothetical protein